MNGAAPDVQSSFHQACVLARSLLKRSLRQRTNQALCACILVCSFIASSIAVFSQSVQTALDHDISNYLGAPLVVRSSNPIESSQLIGSEELTGENFKAASTSSFTSGAVSGSNYQSVTIKGVSKDYPLQGKLMVSFGADPISVDASNLGASEAWLSNQAMNELDVGHGDVISVGQAEYQVAGELSFEPDRLTQLQHAIPRVMVSLVGLRASGVSAGNVRGEHRLLIAGDKVALERVASRANKIDSMEVLTAKAGSHPFSRIAKRAEKLMGMVVVLTLLLCGGAAAILASDVVRRYSISIAVLRSMGVRQRVVIASVCIQMIVLTVFASFIGGLGGWLMQPFFGMALTPHLTLAHIPLDHSFIAKPLIISALAVCCFVLPKFIALGALPVSVILRGGSHNLISNRWSILLATLVVIGMLWASSDNPRLTLLLLISVVVIVSLSLFLAWALSKFASQFHRLLKGSMKVAVRFIGRTPSRYSVQLISTALVMLALLLTTTLRGGFLDTLQVQMLEVDGNYIFSRLPYTQLKQLKDTLNDSGVELKVVHPVVSAQLSEINEVPVDEALSHESETREEARSRVRLTWSSVLPGNNQLISGAWPKPGEKEVSVEAEVMEDLGLKLGDTITFRLSSPTADSRSTSYSKLTARITSVRKYKAGGSRMMFWFVFPEEVLERYQVFAMGGLLIPENRAAGEVIKPLLRAFPQIKVTDLESQISGIRRVMTALTRLMNIIMFTLLGAGATVILASALVNTRGRDKLIGLMRVVGADKNSCIKMGLAEQITVSLVGCLVGMISVQVIGSAMFENVFGLPYTLDWVKVFLLTFVFCGCFALSGYLITLRGLRKPPRLGEY
ncbi:FtsX-like permease family protein [Arenicella sp. 4NH20-0111]|uniref:ABC transporter permease n=1 Tax=Arenicella sp. 4NH20-0111 TaxID=3127648 RepID=UPI0031065ADF